MIALLCWALAVAAQADPSKASDSAEPDIAAQDIRGLEQHFEQAVLTVDLSYFEHVLAEDFTHTNHSGKIRDRKAWLANHTPGKSPYTALNASDVEVRVYGSTAIVTGRIEPHGRDAQGGPIQGQYRFLRVWVKGESGWQIVAFQNTSVSDFPEVVKP